MKYKSWLLQVGQLACCFDIFSIMNLALYCQVRTLKLHIALDCLIVFLLEENKERNYSKLDLKNLLATIILTSCERRYYRPYITDTTAFIKIYELLIIWILGIPSMTEALVKQLFLCLQKSTWQVAISSKLCWDHQSCSWKQPASLLASLQHDLVSGRDSTVPAARLSIWGNPTRYSAFFRMFLDCAFCFSLWFLLCASTSQFYLWLV